MPFAYFKFTVQVPMLALRNGVLQVDVPTRG